MLEHYIPLPTEIDYTVAAEMCQDEYETYGGPFVQIMREELNISSPRSLRDEYVRRATAEVARRVDDGLYPHYAMTHSFARGMRVGYKMVDMVHQQPVYFYDILRVLHNSIAIQSHMDDISWHHDGSNLEDIGEKGLDLIGENAALHVHEWAKDMTPETRLQELIERGAGAVVLGAYALQMNNNIEYINRYIENIDFTSELNDIRPGDTGE